MTLTLGDIMEMINVTHWTQGLKSHSMPLVFHFLLPNRTAEIA